MTAPNTDSDHGSEHGSKHISGHSSGHGPSKVPEPPAPSWLRRTDLRVELLIGLALVAVSAVLGLLMGLLWHLVAPKVPLYADSTAIYLLDPEGEQAIAADMYFAMIGIVIGAALGALAYRQSRGRGGGVSVPVGLTAGGLLGGYIAMRLGVALGPGKNIVATAKSVALGKTFYAPLALTAKGVLLAWPAAALLALVILTSLFTPRPATPGLELGTPLQDRSDTP